MIFEDLVELLEDHLKPFRPVCHFRIGFLSMVERLFHVVDWLQEVCDHVLHSERLRFYFFLREPLATIFNLCKGPQVLILVLLDFLLQRGNGLFWSGE